MSYSSPSHDIFHDFASECCQNDDAFDLEPKHFCYCMQSLLLFGKLSDKKDVVQVHYVHLDLRKGLKGLCQWRYCPLKQMFSLSLSIASPQLDLSVLIRYTCVLWGSTFLTPSASWQSPHSFWPSVRSTPCILFYCLIQCLSLHCSLSSQIISSFQRCAELGHLSWPQSSIHHGHEQPWLRDNGAECTERSLLWQHWATHRSRRGKIKTKFTTKSSHLGKKKQG